MSKPTSRGVTAITIFCVTAIIGTVVYDLNLLVVALGMVLLLGVVAKTKSL